MLCLRLFENGEEFGVGGARGPTFHYGVFVDCVFREVVVFNYFERHRFVEEFFPFGCYVQDAVVFDATVDISFDNRLLNDGIEKFDA